MIARTWKLGVLLVVLGLAGGPGVVSADQGDFDGTGYVDLDDYYFFEICFSISGPGIEPAFQDCLDAFDTDADDDVDMVDYAAFARSSGHLPIPLRGLSGAVLTAGSSEPFSDRETCAGSCHAHDIDEIANGFIHQQGRTDAAGNIIMRDDFYEDGRWWVRGSGMYGRWSGGGGGLNRQMAGKDNANESAMDMTPFYWAANCGACHAGGGGVEFDRDGMRFWDELTGQFGYEVLGKDPADVVLDGDYAFIDDTNGSMSPAPWDITGVADPECLHCHRANRTYANLQDMHREWRGAVLGTTTELVDDLGAPVQAFAAAGTAGQGWFSTLDTQADPPVLQIDYSVGVGKAELAINESDELLLAADFMTDVARDEVCWGCHLPGGFQGKRGTVWFDERDVHFKKFTNRSDEDPRNDLTDAHAETCNVCHPGGLDHNFAKGDSPYAQFRNENDWEGFRSCRECHLTELPNGEPNPDKHPDAPDVPGDDLVHIATDRMLEVLSCQACHVPYPLERANIVTDRSLTGTAVMYLTNEFLSADPLNPADPDKSKWYPNLRWKTDSDGTQRLFPQKSEVAIFWADWDRNGTPEDLSDDTIEPIILWRVRQITGDQPLGIVTDDNGDGKLEVNRPTEMLAYMKALMGADSYGRQVAANPVLVKGERVWYCDPQSSTGVSWFDAEGSGIAVFPFEIFGLDHNVLAQGESWGARPDGDPMDGCNDCHRPETLDAPVVDRLILMDPFDENGQPVYKTIREMRGINPP